MSGVFIANFGIGNALWPRCFSSARIVTYSDDDGSWELWQRRDRESYMTTVMLGAQQRGETLTKPVASRWFNLLSIVEASDGDLWIHREKDELWWASTTNAPAEFSKVAAPWPNANTAEVWLVEKNTTPWSRVSQAGVALSWEGLHPKARQFLFTEATLQELVPDNADYARALLAGKDLAGWHSRSDWLHELSEYVAALLKKQEYVCAITDLPLHVDGEGDDPELEASLDRIDSDKHYEPDNLQVVCRFVNRWKSNSTDASFRRLVALLRRQHA